MHLTKLKSDFIFLNSILAWADLVEGGAALRETLERDVADAARAAYHRGEHTCTPGVRYRLLRFPPFFTQNARPRI
jgi:hypothetical protein